MHSKYEDLDGLQHLTHTYTNLSKCAVTQMISRYTYICIYLTGFREFLILQQSLGLYFVLFLLGNCFNQLLHVINKHSSYSLLLIISKHSKSNIHKCMKRLQKGMTWRRKKRFIDTDVENKQYCKKEFQKINQHILFLQLVLDFFKCVTNNNCFCFYKQITRPILF